jgi:hypothetical protein
MSENVRLQAGARRRAVVAAANDLKDFAANIAETKNGNGKSKYNQKATANRT